MQSLRHSGRLVVIPSPGDALITPCRAKPFGISANRANPAAPCQVGGDRFVISTDSECPQWSFSAAELRLSHVAYCRKSPSDIPFADFLLTDPRS
jgi:hypothetical protein